MPGTRSIVSLCSFAAVGVPVGDSNVFLKGNEILKMYLKTTGRKVRKTEKLFC